MTAFPPSQTRTPRPLPTKKDLFTGGKVNKPELTIFFNLAYFRTAGVIYHLLNKEYTKLKKDLEDIYKDTKWHDDKKVLSGLFDYMFKGYRLAKNASGYEMTKDDEKFVIAMVGKLETIRNFHSHYYHDNSVLIFEDKFKKEINNLHYDAFMSFMGKYPREVEKYVDTLKDNPLFKKNGNDEYMTQDGRTFFLSFFLTRGEMARFLQQSKGYKRNDTDEYNIKHLVFRYFTHRDGSARKHYGHDENVLSTLANEEKNDILNVRQAFKLISYLNDVPEESNDVKLFPLFLDGQKVETLDHYLKFYAVHNFFGALKIDKITKVVKLKLEECTCTPKCRCKCREKTKLCNCKCQVEKEITLENQMSIQFEGYRIELSKNTFHKLILDSIRRNDAGKTVIDQFKKFVTERNDLSNLIETLNPERTIAGTKETITENGKITLTDALDQYYRFKLRNDFLKEKMGKWLEGKEQPPLKRSKDYKPLLKEQTFKNLIKVEPIEVNYHDFYFEADEKLRATDLFVKYAVQYLIDSDKVPDWYFMLESFGTKERTKTQNGIETTFLANKREICYKSKIPENYRLALTPNNQVVVGFYLANEDKAFAPKNKFLLGAHALKNLLIAAREERNKINVTFFKPIIADLNKIRNANGNPIGFNDLKVLEEKHLPQSFKLAMQTEKIDAEKLKAKAKSRIEFLVNELNAMTVPNAPKISRAEKNRQIMRCYKYFDWKYAHDSQFKFLRQDEYQQMSVYHYCLEKRKNKDLMNGDFSFLIEKAMPHVPDVIKNLLSDSNNLDELLVATIAKTVNKLTSWNKEIDKATKQKLKVIFSKLSISLHETTELPDYIPFDIHPALPKRIYFKNEIDYATFSLSSKIWKDETLQRGLRNEHYNYKSFLEKFDLGEDAKKIKKYIIGAMNERIVQDSLLWEMAKYYLNKTSPAYRAFLLGKDSEQNWKVNNLRNTTIETKLGANVLTIKFHQLDDFLLIESTDIIKKAMNQTIKRFKNQLTRTDLEIKTQILMTYADNSAITLPIDETKGFKLPYEEVFKEIQRNFNDALIWAFHILLFEEKLIKPASQNKIEDLVQLSKDNYRAKLEEVDFKNFEKKRRKAEEQGKIIQFEKKVIIPAEIDRRFGSVRIPFEEIIQHAATLSKFKNELKLNLSESFLNEDRENLIKEGKPIPTLKDLLVAVRNKSFHAEIPDANEFSYWELETNLELCKLLDYKPKMKFDYSAGSKKMM